MKKIEFYKDYIVIDGKILVIADFHLGYDERIKVTDLQEKIEEVFDTLAKEDIKIKKIILLGDIKHEFGKITDTEWREVLLLVDFLKKKISTPKKNLIIIKGNHDLVLAPILKKRGIGLKDYYKIGNICFLHGDRFPKECEESRVLFLGHLHPLISLKDRYKSEKYKCFLKGKWKGKEVIVLPSFSLYTSGFDLTKIKNNINQEFFIIKDKDIERFNVLIYDEKDKKILDFKKLKEII